MKEHKCAAAVAAVNDAVVAMQKMARLPLPQQSALSTNSKRRVSQRRCAACHNPVVSPDEGPEDWFQCTKCSKVMH